MVRCLRILVGLPASGKSTYCSSQIGWTVISTDAIRKELYGDESIQGDGAKVFAIAHGRALQALRNGQDVIFDATHLTKRSRSRVRCYKALGYRVEAVVFDTPLDVCKDRNSRRRRYVPVAVIERMDRNKVYPTMDEGFDMIVWN